MAANVATHNDNHAVCEDDFDDLALVNFRPILPGRIGNLYRSSAPESVIHKVTRKSTTTTNSSTEKLGQQPVLTIGEHFILMEANLILDLRMKDEGDDASKEELVTMAPGGAFDEIIVDTDQSFPASLDRSHRYMIRIDLLGAKPEFLHYIDTHWLQPHETDGLDAKEILMKRRHSLSIRGLAGLNQLVLERKASVCRTLKFITRYLEQVPDGKMLIHCTFGKDRTGMICMLLQSVAGFSDDAIVTEYTISDREAKHIVLRTFERHPNPLIDSDSLSGATKEGIEGALFHLRSTYGSVDNYLEDIGFDTSWRVRLQQVLVTS